MNSTNFSCSLLYFVFICFNSEITQYKEKRQGKINLLTITIYIDDLRRKEKKKSCHRFEFYFCFVLFFTQKGIERKIYIYKSFGKGIYNIYAKK